MVRKKPGDTHVSPVSIYLGVVDYGRDRPEE